MTINIIGECKERAGLTFADRSYLVVCLPVALHITPKPLPFLQLPLKQIALVEKQHQLRLRQELIRAHHLPELHTIIQPIDVRVLGEPFVEAANRSEEDDGVDIIEVGGPLGAQGPGATDIVYAPLASGFRTRFKFEDVFLYTNSS